MGGKGIGVFYWEPASYNGWNGYQKGAFDNSGKPTKAMDAFLEGAITGTETSLEQQMETMFFPSPFSENLHIQHSGEFEFAILNAAGEMMQSGKAVNEVATADALPPGIYFLRVKANEIVNFYKVVKQ